ncbi:MAG: hypothetical protein QW215_01885 [Ignisphaera sp.]
MYHQGVPSFEYIRKALRICRMKDLWFIFVPKYVEEILRDKGIDVGDSVMWDVEKIEDNAVTVRVTFSKRLRK